MRKSRSKNVYDSAIRIAELKDPGNSFVSSCKTFLKVRGYLSPKQLNALSKVTKSYSKRRANRYTTHGMDIDECYEEFGSEH